MADRNQKKQGGVSPVVAAVTGAVVGAGVAVAGAVILKDDKNRKKVKKVLTNVKDQALDYVEDVQKLAQDKKGEVKGKLAEGRKKVKKVANSAKKTARTK